MALSPSTCAAMISSDLSILMMIGVIVGYIIFLVAIWKLMRAHESIASSLTSLAQSLQERGSGSNRPTGGQ